jgi:prophage maintenance system killer protein
MIKELTENEIVLFENQEVKLEVNMKDETVWLTQQQMAELFDKDRKTITRHIQNIYKDGELDENTVCSFFEHTANDGKNYNTKYYNLDMIISVGYRVKSRNGIIFRKWANKVLKDYLIKGYAVNQKRLDYLEKTIKLIDIANRIDVELKGSEAREIIKVINNYSIALNLLDDYDHKRISKPDGTIDDKIITYEECKKIINDLKFNNDSNLFALERNEGLKEILGCIYQSFGGVDLYPTIQEKASNLLYMLVKNHVFIDGNKRIAATLFIYFLQYYDILIKEGRQVIDNNTLVAITLLIAESNPNEKQILIDLIMNFL